MLDISDAITALNALFGGEGPLPPPGTEVCGPDTTTGQPLGCDVYDTC